jgi:hypothetical protein
MNTKSEKALTTLLKPSNLLLEVEFICPNTRITYKKQIERKCKKFHNCSNQNSSKIYPILLLYH